MIVLDIDQVTRTSKPYDTYQRHCVIKQIIEIKQVSILTLSNYYNVSAAERFWHSSFGNDDMITQIA